MIHRSPRTRRERSRTDPLRQVVEVVECAVGEDVADSVAIVEAEDEDGVADSELVRDALLRPLREIGVETGAMPCVRLATMRAYMVVC